MIYICAHLGFDWPGGNLWAVGGTCETGGSGGRLEVRRQLAGLLVLSSGGELVPPTSGPGLSHYLGRLRERKICGGLHDQLLVNNEEDATWGTAPVVVLCRAGLVENKLHFFATPEAAWEWLEASGLASGGAVERTVPVPRGKRSRTRRVQRRGETRAGPVACAPDLEQIIQERREAIHSAAAISASPLASESDTELSQPTSDRPVTPDCLLESGLDGGPPVTPATADNLF
ncbi:hypothetical protein NDU88_005374 [Pleurodeles waltl]|uniref:Uncharacterized protein n=1 Tax=Pleurodeles waltl TaxID=8319 RepID=A0AAV7SLQ0_PLEWA|nr:hypothetical protein NDU88_005374 [Pleurodeles waltl]